MLKTNKKIDGPEDLADRLRNKIVSGEWGPGDRLPTRRQIQAEFGSSNLVNAAFRQLLAEGYLQLGESRQEGTRVHPNPPCLTRYAVLLGGTAENPDFHARAVLLAAERLRAEGRNIETYFDLDREFDDPAHVRLCRAVAHHGYAGIFLEDACRERQRGTLLTQREVPVCGAVPQELSAANLAPILHRERDRGQYEQEPPLRHLAASGARSLAVITTGAQYRPARERLFRAVAESCGLHIPDGAYIVAGDRFYSLCVPALRLLLGGDPKRIPDALFVANDNSLPYVVAVLRHYADRPKVRNMQVVATGNYPFLVDFEYPIHYFAYDHLRHLRDGLAFIDAFRRGGRAGSTLSPAYRDCGDAALIPWREPGRLTSPEDIPLAEIESSLSAGRV